MSGSLTIIGAGRVGRALGRALRERGWKVFGVVTRSKPSARRAVRFIGQGHAFAGIAREALSPRNILISTPDSAIPQIAEELARVCAEEWKGKTVLHSRGACLRWKATRRRCVWRGKWCERLAGMFCNCPLPEKRFITRRLRWLRDKC